jgi:hypothetical protein
MAEHTKFGGLDKADDAVGHADAFQLDGHALAQEIASGNGLLTTIALGRLAALAAGREIEAGT